MFDLEQFAIASSLSFYFMVDVLCYVLVLMGMGLGYIVLVNLLNFSAAYHALWQLCVPEFLGVSNLLVQILAVHQSFTGLAPVFY